VLYFGYMLARIIARVMPLVISYWIAERAADIWYLLSSRTRANVAYNLSLVPGAPRSDSERAHLTRRILRNFARVVTEFLYLPRFDESNLDKLVDLESFRDLRQSMEDRPAILITSHLGNWELAAVTLAMLGVNLSVIVFDHPDPRVARLFRKRREAKGLKVMSVKEAVRQIAGALRNTSVGIVGDRDYSGQGREARFLGVKMRVPFAYAGLAVAMERPVVVGFCVRQEDGRYALRLHETVYDPPDDGKTEEEIVEGCLGIFEKGVEKYTGQWYFFERVDRRWGIPRRPS
jgi:KDO2-lipid IV(A) lauroyltransferase